MPCGKGKYASEFASKVCQECAINTYSDDTNVDKITCSPCSKGEEARVTGVGACTPIPGLKQAKDCDGNLEYLDDSNEDQMIHYCRPCPFDGKCPSNGMKLSELSTEPGYWRSSADSEIYSPCSKGYRGLNANALAEERCCPKKQTTNVSICKDLNSTSFQADAQCLTGYVGALCLVCANDYVKMGGECIACPGGASFTTALIPLGIVSGTLFIFVLLYLCCNAKKKNNATPDSRKVNRFFGQLKILLSFFQIFSSMPSVLDSVPWPNVVLEFSIPFSVFNLDVLTLLSQTSCGVSVRFFSRFLLHMILPFFCLVAVGMAYILSRACKTRVEARTRLNEKASKVIILITLLLFPGLTTKIFQVGKCQSIKGIEFKLLVQDAAITCYQGEHFTFIFIAVGFFCLYVVGIPLTMFMLMWKNRKHLHDETSSRHAIVKKALGGLYSQCKLMKN